MSGDVIIERPHLFLGSRLKRLAEQMQGDAAMVTQSAGMPIQPGQYPLLATLDAQGSKTIGELARAMRLSQPAISKNVGKLAAVGLVAIDRSGADRRQRAVSLTAAGQAAIDQSKAAVWPLVQAAVEEITHDLCGPLLEQIAMLEARLSIRSLATRAQLIAAGNLVPATTADVPDVVSLMNHAYRPPRAAAGWSNETDYIDGDRTSEVLLRQDMAANNQANLLIWRRSSGDLQGCVWLEPLGDDVWYLGSLTVEPRAQNAGFGRQLLMASETWVRARGGREIKLTVINVRDSLIAWYTRRGYRRTGQTEPFPYADPRFGVPKRPDLCFAVLRKLLA